MPGITDLLGSDTENTNFIDENSLISSASDTLGFVDTKSTVAKKPKKRKCITLQKKPRATKVAVKSESELPAPKAGAKRKANKMDVAIDEDDILETEPLPTKHKSKTSSRNNDTTSAAANKTKARSHAKTIAPEVNVAEQPPSPVNVRSNFASSKTARSVPKPVLESKTKKSSAGRTTKSVAQSTENVISDAEEDDDIEMMEVQPPRKKARTESRIRQEPTYRRRAGSASDTERGDPMLRRKLGDVTRRYENMEVRYRNLKEVGISEANANMERLQKECDNIKDGSAKLVSSLKQQLAEQAPMVQECRKLKKDAQAHESEHKKLQAVKTDLSTSLAAAQAEIKSLQAKLSAAKATPVPVEVKIPASVHKNASQSTKSALGANNELPHKQQLKLDLYSDLTGLIVRDVKQNEDGDTFDCIQTGREGRKFC